MSTDSELLTRLFKTAAASELDEMRHAVRSIYGALCIEAGVDKETALAEFADHWDKFEAFAARMNVGRRLN